MMDLYCMEWILALFHLFVFDLILILKLWVCADTITISNYCCVSGVNIYCDDYEKLSNKFNERVDCLVAKESKPS